MGPSMPSGKRRASVQVRPLSRDTRAQSNLFSSQAEYITAQLENLVQSGRTAGTEFAERVQKRVASLV